MDWYKKLLSFYRDEEDQMEDSITPDDHQNKDLQTRVAYQYPKLPHRKTTNHQAYEETRNRPQTSQGISNIHELLNNRHVKNRYSFNEDKEKEEIRTEQVDHKITLNENKTQTKEKIITESEKNYKKTPFQPTEIPSPIFGFQRKKKQNDIIEFELTSFELEYETKTHVYFEENNIKENNTYIHEKKQLACNESNPAQVEENVNFWSATQENQHTVDNLEIPSNSDEQKLNEDNKVQFQQEILTQVEKVKYPGSYEIDEFNQPDESESKQGQNGDNPLNERVQDKTIQMDKSEQDLAQDEVIELNKSEHILEQNEKKGLEKREENLAQDEVNELVDSEMNIAKNGPRVNEHVGIQEEIVEENEAVAEVRDELSIDSSTEIQQMEDETEERIDLDGNIAEVKSPGIDEDTDKNEQTEPLITSQEIEKERNHEDEQSNRTRTPKKHLPFNVIMLKKDRELWKKRNERRATAEKNPSREDLKRNNEEMRKQIPATQNDEKIETNKNSSSSTLSSLLAHASMEEELDDNNIVVEKNDDIISTSQPGVITRNDHHSTVKEWVHAEKQISTTISNNEYETYEFPSREFLKKTTTEQLSEEWIEDQKAILNNTLRSFHVGAKVVDVAVGPTVTRFELSPDLGVKVSKITNLTDDLKLSLAAKDIRIEAPIPGKHTIGIEVPNKVSRPVFLRDIINEPTFNDANSPLTAALGLDITGKPVITDIKKMPHGLIAGATGSGKSVCINTFIISLLYKAKPDEVKLLLIDPKMVELSPYNGIPHLISPVITDIKAATQALKWAVDEMERRYELFAHTGVRDIGKFNEKCDIQEQKLPYIVIVIDELADLMMMAPNDVEEAIARIAQKARACGIHLLIATQRPSVDVITGLIKANVPTRIAFSVSSQIDSRTIIDISGAERLLGKGDMLFVENGTAKPFRVQGAFISDEEIEKVVEHVRMQGEPNYLFEQEELIRKSDFAENDELLYEACEFAFEQGNISTSSLQRHFRIGYNRAARIIELMENKGMISEARGSKPRDVLMTNEDLERLKEFL
ncbi:DNA translocase FtsK [Bacillus andreraoultii]|uniref:DNA translocase FtsK n=1 Tax=Bacillus andreraoultii TaxID=1499685 RepID=UPI00067EA69A|nr:DNA translocase FtsK [Bacillus andreraoultii]